MERTMLMRQLTHTGQKLSLPLRSLTPAWKKKCMNQPALYPPKDLSPLFSRSGRPKPRHDFLDIDGYRSRPSPVYINSTSH